MPSHNHYIDITTQNAGKHKHTIDIYKGRSSTFAGLNDTTGFSNMQKSYSTMTNYTSEENGEHNHKIQNNTNSTGNGTQYWPLYYRVYYWKRIG